MNSKTKVFSAALAVVALAAFGLVTAAFADGSRDVADDARQWGPGHFGGQWFGSMFSACTEETLQHGVEEGLLTQEQADAILERFENDGPFMGAGPYGMHQGFFGQEISPEALQEKVEEGILTQEQADAILERIENGERGFGHRPGGMHGWGSMMR